MNRSELRARLWEITTCCEWTGCHRARKEMAHLHSIGMGGRPSADVLENVAALCADHALMSDGARPGGTAWYVAEHDRLFNAAGLPQRNANDPQLAWWRAEALRIVVVDTRGWVA